MSTIFDGVRMVVFPAIDFEGGIATWTKLLGQPPLYGNDDFCVFDGGNVQIGLNRRPWVYAPIVFFKVDDINEAHKQLAADGSIPITNVGDGDPETGIVHLPTVILAIFRGLDGNLFGIRQDLPWG